jgi:signal transduction histidine kinase
MGLGLSIVKGIIDAHQGAIRELGEAGEGAQFTIFLPIVTD